MRDFLTTCNRPLTNESFDARLAQWVGHLGAVAILPTSVVAVTRHAGGRAAFLLGMGLAVLISVLLVMLGMLLRGAMHKKLALRKRLLEFASYAVCLGFFIAGIMSLSGLGLNESDLVLYLLVVSSLSLAVLDVGMLSSVLRALEE